VYGLDVSNGQFDACLCHSMLEALDRARPLIVTCRVCADEALAAHQPSMPASARATKPAPSGFSVRSLITNCRACRDEALAGTQASFGTVDSGIVFPQLDDPHQPGPR
jgi:hypothetical protein